MDAQRVKELLDELMKVTVERDAFFDETPTPPVGAAPATANELADLQAHWKVALPPTFRHALEAYNGISGFWIEVPLLSTAQIINDSNEASSFEEFFPSLWRGIIACDTDSYDAIALDLSELDDDGEAPVVQIGEEGEEQRWPSFGAFLEGVLELVKAERDKEQADRDQLPD